MPQNRPFRALRGTERHGEPGLGSPYLPRTYYGWCLYRGAMLLDQRRRGILEVGRPSAVDVILRGEHWRAPELELGWRAVQALYGSPASPAS